MENQVKSLGVEKPLTFLALSDIIVTDNRGVFYACEKDKIFNLPKGIYTIKGVVKEFNYKPNKLPVLPKSERNEISLNDLLDKLKVSFAYNPAKASINIYTGEIVIDSELNKKLSTPEFMFIYLHELGHLYYKTEWKCDMYAMYQMLKKGFNYSQCKFSINQLLKPSNRTEQNNNFLYCYGRS